jgi:2'-5' RNA ligase
MESSLRSRFFIAFLAPPVVHDYATKVIQDLRDRYGMDTAKAAPHITLIPPFEWAIASLSHLEETLQQFATSQPPIPLQISGFGRFGHRVLYLNVERTPALMTLQRSLSQQFEIVLGIADEKEKQRGFSPHLTVASRHVTRQTFQQAWAELQPQAVDFQWRGDRLTLLRHDGRQWHTHSHYGLAQL